MSQQKKYDVFISYRTVDTRHLASILNYVINANHPEWEVSFDHVNLYGRWPVELIRRVDNTKNLVVLVGKNTFNFQSQQFEEQEVNFYENLSNAPIEEYKKQISELLKNGVHIDFLRLELNRAFRNNLTVIPIVIYREKIFDIDSLSLPKDLMALKSCQGLTYHDHVLNSSNIGDLLSGIELRMNRMGQTSAESLDESKLAAELIKKNEDSSFGDEELDEDIEDLESSDKKISRKIVASQFTTLEDVDTQVQLDVNKVLAMLPDSFYVEGFFFSKDYDNGGVKIIYDVDYKDKRLIEIPSSISYKNQVLSVTAISNSAFWGCTRLEVITIPDSVVGIGECAFYGCRSLVSITFSKNITYIGKGAFKSCSSLKSIVIPNAVKCLDYDVFLDCISLQEITLPNSLENVEDSAFWGCYNILKVYIPISMKKKYEQLLSPDIYKNVVCEQKSKNKKIRWTILGTIFTAVLFSIIAILALSRKMLQLEYNHADMTATVMEKRPIFRLKGEIEIPSHVNRLGKVYTMTRIANNAFKDAYSLTYVTIPSSISIIGCNAFSNCSSLSTIIIPNSVIRLSSSAFERCINLTSVTIGKNIRYIESYVFSDCVSLDTVYYSGTVKQWERIIKGGFWAKKVPADVIHCVDGDVNVDN